MQNIMTGDKTVASLAFVLLGLVLTVAVPLSHGLRTSTAREESMQMPPKGRLRMALGLALGLLVMAALPWWLRQPGQWLWLALPRYQAMWVVLLTLVVAWMLTRDMSAARDSPLSRRLRMLIYACFALSLLCLVFSTGWLRSFVGTSLWHHWGAYVGPALLVAEGARPLFDIPAQYGLGVTLALVQGCQIDCWSAMYWIAGAMTSAMALLLAYLALQFNESRHPLSVLAILAIVLVCCLFWTASPRNLAAPLSFPSTTGARFLPGVLMLTLLVRHVRAGRAGQMPPVWGHLLWLACIMWSPEAGLHATVLWGPFFVWTHTWRYGSHGRPARFARAVMVLLGVLAAGVTVMALGYRQLLGSFPDITTYLAYILYPPGPLPVNPFGTIWFALVCAACWGFGAWSLQRRRADHADLAIISWLVALLCFANFTYYLGRSHDNNILNLLPFFSLVLLAARSMAPPGAVHMLSTMLLAACLGWLPVFGFGSLSTAFSQGRLLEFAPAELAKAFSRNPERGSFYVQPEKEREDLQRALHVIRRDFGEPVEIFDRFLLVDTEVAGPPWNAWTGPANFGFLPPHLRQLYLARVAKRLGRSGWILHADGQAHILNDYDAVYRRAEELSFGSYRAVRFVPR
jgi:hypothetical protein